MLSGLFSMMLGMNRVSMRYLSVMRRLFMAARFVVLRGFRMMLGRMRVVLRGLLMMFGWCMFHEICLPIVGFDKSRL